jgi:hypothetical protein
MNLFRRKKKEPPYCPTCKGKCVIIPMTKEAKKVMEEKEDSELYTILSYIATGQVDRLKQDEWKRIAKKRLKE